MARSPRWRRRVLLMTGLAAAGMSLASLIQLSGDPDLNGSTIWERRQRLESAEQVIRLGWTAWADAELVSLMAEQLIEEHFDVPVDRVMADIGVQFESVARGRKAWPGEELCSCANAGPPVSARGTTARPRAAARCNPAPAPGTGGSPRRFAATKEP